MREETIQIKRGNKIDAPPRKKRRKKKPIKPRGSFLKK